MDKMNLNQDSALPKELSSLYQQMEKTDNSVIPFTLVLIIHRLFPQFAVRQSGESEATNLGMNNLLAGMASGGFQQQDANEFWMCLMLTLQSINITEAALSATSNLPPSIGNTGGWNPVDRFFTRIQKCTLKCIENPDEPTSEFVETHNQLSCYINQDVKYMQTGIKNGFETTVIKTSELMKKDVEYKKVNQITRLPAYMCVQFIRFFYKEKEKINAKILKNVAFPMNFDVYEFCSPELKDKLQPMRDRSTQEKERAVFAAPKNKKPGQKEEKSPDPYENPQLYEPYWFDDDIGSNNTGLYELQGVLTHQGRSSNSGHYVGWAKRKGDWFKFDDEKVTLVNEEQIKALAGGGDWHCAYLLLYGPERVPKAPTATSDEATPMDH